MKKQLNAEQRAALAPYERQMRTATEARWVSHIPQSGIDIMLGVWKELTGTDRVFRQGCGTCILNLVADLGVLYFAVDPEKEAIDNGFTKFMEKAAEKPAEAPKPAKVSKTTSKAKKPASGKDNK